jgi:hypothetical protein
LESEREEIDKMIKEAENFTEWYLRLAEVARENRLERKDSFGFVLRVMKIRITKWLRNGPAGVHVNRS